MLGGTCAFTIIALAVNLLHTDGYDYCTNETAGKICPNGKMHFMCEQRVVIPQASFISEVAMTKSLRRFVLQKFNEFRNTFAGGEEEVKSKKKFPKAARMREVIWDWELAYMAKLFPNRCANVDTDCYNTINFPDVYLLVLFNSGPKPMQARDEIQQRFDTYRYERHLVTDPVNFVKTFNLLKYASIDLYEPFAPMLNERLSRIGCGAAYCNYCRDHKYCFYFSCFFDADIHTNDMIYTTTEGDTASNCSHWNTDKSFDYENLCANSSGILLMTLAAIVARLLNSFIILIGIL